ncbi:hypothetical protein [Mycolicibacterium monacense]|uniref:Uncharacterized protein n=1 Tax=Mycolicibacterium monacense TaxID=85693 RepID=A0AAD1J2I8_MYCMB|nr:hypothetical protein [Mycolicibacterium monacense]ORB20591.1 hypothetical protein BST34_11990 [Mycolicibacterium monacense DSM 44395]QHP88109.1 hypothetical protein EWR22_23685 [Mycolicibacterium monacense DSM 44395]BBZ64515.1 hypothetical protein MMON_58160 [Mycolicibacterium monacense]
MTTKKRRLTRADLTDRERRHLAACVHEAGHAVACAMLGGEIHSAVVSNGRIFGLQGSTTFAQLPDTIDARVTYAGLWAEARWEHGPRPTTAQLRHLRRTNGHDDARLCAAATADVYGYGDPSREARSAVPPLLDRAWPAVVRVAQQLFTSGEATHDDVCKALGITDGGGTGSSQIASLRAGLRSVPKIAAVPA